MKNRVINLYMWGYQDFFQVSIQVTAQQLFNKIEPGLQPNTFLVGILVEAKENRHPVCLQPEDCGYSVNAFAKVKELAQELERVSEEGKIHHSHPIAQSNHNKQVSNQALMDAIKKILTSEDTYGDSEKFISYPTYVDGYLVFVVLELKKKALGKHYSLRKERFNDRYKIQRSFIESAVDIYLKECANALKDPEATLNVINRESDELMREAGKSFMYTIAQAGMNFDGLHGLYDACNSISSLKYEGQDGIGKMAIAEKNHPNIKLTLQLFEPIAMRNFRKVRKFLELSNENSIIVSDSALIYGLGELKGKYNPQSESLFMINFLDHYRWEVMHDENAMMLVEYRQPTLPKESIDRDKFYSDLERIFEGISRKNIENLWDLTIEATKQKHGTMLVITDDAASEAQRLKSQSFLVEPIILSPKVIQQITSIDGCVLLDRSSTCHAFGVILDGVATTKGDSARGARYNSAIRYYEQHKSISPTVIVIISEDGMINLIPYLRPKIKHSFIERSIKELKEIEQASQTGEVNRKSFNEVMSFFEQVEFYLSAEECALINDLKTKVDKNDKDIESMKIVRRDLKSNPEMNDSYFEVES